MFGEGGLYLSAGVGEEQEEDSADEFAAHRNDMVACRSLMLVLGGLKESKMRRYTSLGILPV